MGEEKARRAPRSGAFWRRIERRAGSRKAIARARSEAGHETTETTVGFWARGDVDPGLEAAIWASERWDESIVEPPEEQRLRDQVAELQREVGLLRGEVEGWKLEIRTILGQPWPGAPVTESQEKEAAS